MFKLKRHKENINKQPQMDKKGVTMRKPCTLQLHLVNGEPEGIRTAQLTTRTVKVIEFPVGSRLMDFIEMPESAEPAVLFKVGANEVNQLPKVQVLNAGEGSYHHLVGLGALDGWSSCYIAVSTNNPMSATHTSYIARQAEEIIKSNGRYRVLAKDQQNRVSPNVPVFYESECDDILDVLEVILASLGAPLLSKEKNALQSPSTFSNEQRDRFADSIARRTAKAKTNCDETRELDFNFNIPKPFDIKPETQAKSSNPYHFHDYENLPTSIDDSMVFEDEYQSYLDSENMSPMTAEDLKKFEECIDYDSLDDVEGIEQFFSSKTGASLVDNHVRDLDLEPETVGVSSYLDASDTPTVEPKELEEAVEQSQIAGSDSAHSQVNQSEDAEDAEEILDPKVFFEDKVFYCKGRTSEAKGIYNPESKGITILKDSIIRYDSANTIPDEALELKKQLRADKLLRKLPSNRYKLLEDVEVRTLTTAASLVVGGQASGGIYWVDDNGEQIRYILKKQKGGKK